MGVSPEEEEEEEYVDLVHYACFKYSTFQFIMKYEWTWLSCDIEKLVRLSTAYMYITSQRFT